MTIQEMALRIDDTRSINRVIHALVEQWERTCDLNQFHPDVRQAGTAFITIYVMMHYDWVLSKPQWFIRQHLGLHWADGYTVWVYQGLRSDYDIREGVAIAHLLRTFVQVAS